MFGRSKLRFYLGLVFWVGIFSVLQAQGQQQKRYKLSVIPLVFYTPETQFGFGGAGIATFQLPQSQLESQLQLGFAYTTLSQILLYSPFQVFTKNIRLEGELGYYRYTYKFFGIGNDIPFSYEEDYDVAYPRLRLAAYYKFKNHFWLGIQSTGDWFETLALEPGKRLASGTVAGAFGSRYLGGGPSVIYDSRDNNFYPSQGCLVNASYQIFPKWSDSYDAFQKVAITTSTYRKIGSKSIAAAQVGYEQALGAVPFYQLASLGGTKILRGYYADRFRDRCATFFQTEYRFMPSRFGFTIFANAGWIANQASHFAVKNTISTLGAGLRYQLQPNRKLNLRFDAGYGTQGVMNYYFTVLEAF